MPSPSSALNTLRPDLGGSYEEFDLAMDRLGYIGSRVLPVIESQKASGPFGVITLESLLQSDRTVRGNEGNYQRGNFQFTTSTFATVEYGFEVPVDDREASIYSEYLDAEMFAAELARHKVLQAYEERVAAAVFNTTTWTATTVTNEWDDATNATPITDVKTAKLAVHAACGMWPNALIINKEVFLNLREVDQIVERLKYQGFQDVRSSAITANALAQVFDLDMVLVAGGTNNTADEGQTGTPALIWSNEYAMIAKIPTTGNIREPGIGRTIHYGEDGSTIGTTVETYREEKIRSDVARSRMDVDEIIIHAECGELLDNITT